INYVYGNLSVIPAGLTATVTGSQVYGGSPSYSATYAGFVNGQNALVVSGSLSCSTSAVASSPVGGVYTISNCSGLSAPNYTINYVYGNLSVIPAGLTVIASSPADGVYGGPVPVITASYVGFVNGQGPTNLTTQPICQTNYTQTADSTPKRYRTFCSGGVSGNYDFGYIEGSFRVGKEPLQVTASNPADGVYGAPMPAIPTSYTQAAGSAPMRYRTFCSGGVSGNYDFGYIGGSFKVGKAPLSVTASSPADGVYGAPVPAITTSYSGFVYGQGATDLTSSPSCTTSYTQVASSVPGTYGTSCSGGVSGNYDFSYIGGSFKVGKAPLSVTASSPADGVYGAPVPAITTSYSGFVYGQGATDLTSSPSCTTSYTQVA